MANFYNIHSTLTDIERSCEDMSNADFGKAQAIVKVFEGGYSDNPKDSGNWTGGKIGVGTLVGTNHGISAPVLKAYLNREPTVADVKALKYETALQIYKSQFWDAIGGDKIINEDIALLIYDGAVNHGVGGMKKIVSDSLGTAYNTDSINKAKQKELFTDIKKRREERYKSLGGTFLTGWLNRLSKITFNDVTQFTKRNWIPLTISLVGIATLTYFGFKYRDQIAKAIFK